MKVAVIMGSTSDYEIMSAAIKVLEEFGVESARERGIGAIIAGAGGAAHVAGVVAGMTTVPVIGVPIQTKALGGMDSLLSIVQMPGGIPVATMAINGRRKRTSLICFCRRPESRPAFLVTVFSPMCDRPLS